MALQLTIRLPRWDRRTGMGMARAIGRAPSAYRDVSRTPCPAEDNGRDVAIWTIRSPSNLPWVAIGGSLLCWVLTTNAPVRPSVRHGGLFPFVLHV
jgi:hypothetical protein